MRAICSVNECDVVSDAKGFCNKHYQRWLHHGDANWSHPSAIDRLMSQVSVSSGTGCWEWIGFIQKNGYAKFYVGGKSVWAHRFSYEFHNCLIPEGLHVDHLCVNPKCVNPDHLEAVEPKENVHRSSANGGLLWNRPTHCKRGHEFSEQNTLRLSRGSTECRACKNERRRKK